MGELGNLTWVAVVDAIVWGGLGWYVWRLALESRRRSAAADPGIGERPNP